MNQEICMKKKKQFALNRLFNCCVFFGLFLAAGAISLFLDNEIAWGCGFAAVDLLFIVIPAIFTPYCYAFDSEGVSLCYVFLPVERYLWKDIHAIDVYWDHWGRSYLLNLLFGNVFSIKGVNVGDCRFYMNGHIRKSLRTKYLLEKYWDGTITGYLFEDTKKWLRERKEKKEAHTKAHLADEIVPMEREVRAEVREWLLPFIGQAKQLNVEIRAKYSYVTNDFRESNSRPDEGYTYTLNLEIAQPGETDDERIMILSVDMIYVRLGKTSYRGVKNKFAKEELELRLSEELDEISKNGFEAYLTDL